MVFSTYAPRVLRALCDEEVSSPPDERVVSFTTSSVGRTIESGGCGTCYPTVRALVRTEHLRKSLSAIKRYMILASHTLVYGVWSVQWCDDPGAMHSSGRGGASPPPFSTKECLPSFKMGVETMFSRLPVAGAHHCLIVSGAPLTLFSRLSYLE